MADLKKPEVDGTAGTQPAADPAALFEQMSETEFRALYEQLRGTLRWGPGDRHGALNYITPAEVLAAVSEVRLGRSVSLAAPVEHQPTADLDVDVLHRGADRVESQARDVRQRDGVVPLPAAQEPDLKPGRPIRSVMRSDRRRSSRLFQ